MGWFNQPKTVGGWYSRLWVRCGFWVLGDAVWVWGVADGDVGAPGRAGQGVVVWWEKLDSGKIRRLVLSDNHMTLRKKTYRWEFRDNRPEVARTLAERYRLNAVVASVIANRGLGGEEAALAGFMTPRLSTLHDPFSMADMEAGVARTIAAIRGGENVVVFGDYDADGITSTALMFRVLRHAGANVSFYVPHRVDEGYGINAAALEMLARRGAQLIITVDNGISAVEQVARARELGVDVIVTDHHQAGDVLPDALAVINPNRPDCGYACKHLTGVGVAFKFGHALLKSMGRPAAESTEFLRSLLDLVAIGTIADMAPLQGENRVLASHGLACIKESRNAGIVALRDHLKLSGNISGTHVGFQIAPRLNAAGRTSHADIAVELLTTDDPEKAAVIVEELEACNRQRRAMEGRIFEECIALIEKNGHGCGSVMVIDGDDWHLGVVGIVASRVMDHVDKPAIILTGHGAYAKGSARSFGAFNLYEALTACQDYLVAYGGHPHAAGMTMAREKVPAFREAINEFAAGNCNFDQMTPPLVIDAEVDCRALDHHLMEHLRCMEPFGHSNPQPVFAARGLRLNAQPRVVGEKHLKMQFAGDGVTVDGIGFNMGHLAHELNGSVGVELDVAYSPTLNDWWTVPRVEMEIKDLRLSS